MAKTILITGTSTGFGKLTALTLAAKGYSVVATMRQVAGKNKTVAKQLSDVPNIDVIEMDVTDDRSVNSAVAYTLSTYGAIDVLVNNAGVAGTGLLEAYSIDQIKRLFDINVYGVLRTYKAVLPSMRTNRNGLIINMSSGLGLFVVGGTVPYAASKFVVEAITEGYNAELRSFGIDSVSIQAGAYPTEIGSKEGINADERERIAAYGDLGGPSLEEILARIRSNIKAFNMHPQVIADGIAHLIGLEQGTRPGQYPLDAVAQEADREYIESRNLIRSKWISNHA